MKKIILAPDSFKGTMSSSKICDIMADVIYRYFNDSQIIKIPVADGGEGTVDCFLKAIGGKKINVKAKGPYFEDINSFYGILPGGETAVIEMAAAAGLPMVEGKLNPLLTTTYGVGQLIEHSIKNGCRKIIIGLGGSSTNDGGAGMAAALGIKFYNDKGQNFVPVGGNLNSIVKIDLSEKMPELKQCAFTAMCDVNNLLYGKNGASYVFGPQKGADEDMALRLDKNIQHFALLIKNELGMDLSNIKGAGAAGGMGAGVMAFLGARLNPGIDTVLDTVGFENLLNNADLVLTGEGKIDAQSLSGKVVAGVAKRAKLKNVPVIAIVGDIDDKIEQIYSEGITAIVSINRHAIPFAEARARSETDLALTVDSLMRIIKSGIR